MTKQITITGSVDFAEVKEFFLSAEEDFSCGIIQNIPKLLKTSPADIIFDDSIFEYKYSFLFALGCLHNNRIDEVETICDKYYESSENKSDFYYLMAHLALKLKDHRNAVVYSDRFFKHLPESKNLLTGTSVYKSDIYNLLGSAYFALDDNENSIRNYETALVEYPCNYKVYINLAMLYRGKYNIIKAVEIIEHGIKNCPEIDELKMLKASFSEISHHPVD